jgi:outer membrane protein
MKKIGVSIIFAALVSAAFAQTNPPASRPLSLQDCFAAALQNNLGLQVARFNPQISQLNLSSAYAGYDPQFNFKGTHTHSERGAYLNSDNQLVLPTESDQDNFSSSLTGLLPWGMTYNLGGNIYDEWGEKNVSTNIFNFDSSAGEAGLTLTQPLLKNFWIDGNRLQIQIAKNNVKISDLDLRSQVISTVTEVENAYFELIHARENVQVRQEALALAQKQLSDDKARVEIGTLAEAGGALEQGEAEVAQNRASLISALNNLGSAQRALKTLITDEYSTWLDADIQPTLTLEAPLQLFDLQDSWSKGMTHRPDLQRARIDLESQGVQLKYYRNQLYPQLDLIGSYGFSGSGREYHNTFDQLDDGHDPVYTYGGQLSIPLSNTKARNQLKAGKINEKQLLLGIKSLEQGIMVGIDNAVGVAKSGYESVSASRQARIFAEAALKAEQGKYAAGKSTTFTVLQLQNKLTAARLLEIRAMVDYNKALASLAAAEGTTLQRRNLEVQVK